MPLTTLEDLGITRRQTTLPSGLPVVAYERPGMPLELIAVFDAGARHDPLDKEGLAHATEHVRVSGTREFKSKVALSEFAESFGGHYNASTSLSHQRVIASVSEPSQLPQAAHLLGEILEHPLLDPKQLDIERGAILQEARQSASQPATQVRRLWQSVLYQGLLESRSIIGSSESIRSLVHQDIENFYQRHLTKPLKIIACGGATLETVSRALSEELSAPPATPLSAQPVKSLPPFTEQTLAEQQGSGGNTELIVGYLLPKALTLKERACLQAIKNLLCGARTSRLFKSLRLERGLIYGIQGLTTTFPDLHSLGLKTACDPEKLEQVLGVVRQEITRLAGEDIFVEELNQVKNRMTLTLRERLQTVSAVLEYHFTSELLDEKTLTMTEEVIEIDRLTPADLRQFATTYLTAQSFRLALCGDLPPRYR